MSAQSNDSRPLPPLIGQQSTLLSSWIITIYRLLEYRSLDASRIYRDAGVKPRWLRSPDARVPHHLMSEIWERALKISGDQCIALDAARVIFPGMYHSLSMAMYTAQDLLTALQYLARYRRIFHPLSRMQFEEVDDGFRFSWDPREPYVTAWGADAVIASMLGMCRVLSSPDFAPLSVCIKRRLPLDEQATYREFFQAPVNDNNQQNSMIFDREMLQRSLPTHNPRMERFAIQTTRDYISYLDRTEIVNTVYCKILEALPYQEHTEDAIAQDLHISLRTMQRRLQQAGTTYDRVLQDTRKELALSYLKDKALSIQEVSYLVGFSEPTNFSRAFKRWLGRSPKEYRNGGC